MTSIIERYPMNNLRQAHASMWMATRDLHAGKISADEFGELRGYLLHRMEKLDPGSAKRQAIKSWLMSTASRLTNQATSR
jgi:hypothetical protein